MSCRLSVHSLKCQRTSAPEQTSPPNPSHVSPRWLCAGAASQLHNEETAVERPTYLANDTATGIQRGLRVLPDRPVPGMLENYVRPCKQVRKYFGGGCSMHKREGEGHQNAKLRSKIGDHSASVRVVAICNRECKTTAYVQTAPEACCRPRAEHRHAHLPSRWTLG